MAAQKQKVLLDTDIGDDIDDALALAACIRHPELELVGVTTVWRDTELRAAQARLLLEVAGAAAVEVAAGSRDGLDCINPIMRNHQADVLSAENEERLRKGRTDAIRFLAEKAREHEGLTLMPVAPQTNVARFIVEFPDDFARIGRLVIMGGHTIADCEKPEYNARGDPRATKVVFGCGKPITMVGEDVTLQCRLRPEDLEAIGAKDTPLSRAIMRMTELFQQAGRPGGRRRPIVHDPLAVLVAADPSFVRCEDEHIEIDEQGGCVKTPGKPNVAVAVEVDADRVRRTLVELIG
jgi:purine nucleosidase